MLKPGNLNGSRVCVIPSLGKFLQLVLRGSGARACPWSLGPGPLGPWALGPLPLVPGPLGPCPWALGPLPLVPGPLGPCPLGPGPLSLGPWALGPWVSHPNGANGSRSVQKSDRSCAGFLGEQTSVITELCSLTRGMFGRADDEFAFFRHYTVTFATEQSTISSPQS